MSEANLHHIDEVDASFSCESSNSYTETTKISFLQSIDIIDMLRWKLVDFFIIYFYVLLFINHSIVFRNINYA